jgi:Flp pilus assembly protein TadG
VIEPRLHRNRGSVLMLMPAGVLVVLLLGAISFDLSLVFLRQRQASSVAVDVANDLASAAFDEDLYRSTGTFTLDPATADDLGARFVAASDLSGDVVAADVDVLASDTVRVTLTVRVDYVFAKAIPGAADGTTVTAHATAVAVPG